MPSAAANHPLLAAVLRLIEQRGPRIAILGPPGSGKSTLLESVAWRLESKGIQGAPCRCIHLDLRKVILGPESSMYEQLAEMAQAGASEDTLPRGAGKSFPQRLVTLASQASGYLVIAVDHLDNVPYQFAAELAQHLRNIKEMSEGGMLSTSIGIIICGSVSLFRLRRQTESGLAQTAPFTLPRLGMEDRKKLVRAAGRGRAAKLTAGALECLAEQTGGEPAFLLPVLNRMSRSDGREWTAEEVRAVIRTVPFDESPCLRNVLLSVLYDCELAAIATDIAAGEQRLMRIGYPDIDPYQLGGAIIADPSQFCYRPRNGIVGSFIGELQSAMPATGAPASRRLVREILELREAPNTIGGLEDIRSATPVLRRAWEITTSYSKRARLDLAVSRAGGPSRWLELLDSHAPESAIPRPEATNAAAAEARRRGGFVLQSDTDSIAYSVVSCWKDFTGSLTATIARREGQFSEAMLIHWGRFAEGVIPLLIRLVLYEWGGRTLSEPCATVESAKAREYDIFLSSASSDGAEAEAILAEAERMGVKLYHSAKNLEAGFSFSDQIREALTKSDELWLLASPKSLDSVWLHTEWGAAWVLGKPIIPVLFRVAPEDLPDRLKMLQVIDYHRFRDQLMRVARRKVSAAVAGASGREAVRRATPETEM